MTFNRWIAPAVGLILLVLFLLLPPIEPLTATGMKVTGIMLFTIIWWATVSVGIPSLLCLVLLTATGTMPAADVFSSSWGHWLVIFIIGVMGLSGGLQATGFSRRFAVWFMDIPIARGRPWVMLAMLLLACSLLGMVMSLTANCIIFMSIAESMLEGMGFKKGDRFASMMMLGIAWASTSSFVMTPIANIGNLMVIEWLQRDTGVAVGFLQWFVWGIPMGLMVFMILFAVYRFVVKPDVSGIGEMSQGFIRKTKAEIGPMKTPEMIAVGVFLSVILCWLIPDFLGGLFPDFSAYLHNLGVAIPPLAGASLLCLITVERQPVLRFDRWMKEYVDWGTIALVATVAILGSIVGKPETGIPRLLADIFQPVAIRAPVMVFVLISVSWVILQTNAMSNVVSMTLVYTVMVPVMIASGTGNAVALGVTIAAASNLAFALPSATTSTALVTGSGWVPVSFLSRYGFMLSVPMILLFSIIGYMYATLIFG